MIFVVDKTYSDEEATVGRPHEFPPLPEKDDVLQGLNRAGEPMCSTRLLRVTNPRKHDHTLVMRIAVPKELTMEVWSIAVPGG